ncbi:MAG: hypothetical protein A2255_04535 [Candidatus Melainabacteria bacterium RIFOXYA2_FULL_32_9]|nr:MAG: hypothetical protein A2255_04535 [Candidatus Melainabacteria bacterium RIFOXYA2_FULL_32_9]
MPLDGLSFSNSGLFRIVNPTEVALQAEHQAQAQAETAIKKPEEKEKVKPDLEDKTEDQYKDLQGRNTDESEDEENEVLQKQEKIKKYKVKFNSLTDMVELIDQKTGSIIETISPDDLINLISKTVKPSGILVDKEV